MIETKHFTRFALTCVAAFALGAASTMTSCDNGGEEPTAPVITITTQPTSPAALTEGAIPADTKLTVVATATEGATLTYQWYSNTTASNEGGTAIDGATAASYTLPTTLVAGTYYYFCEVGAGGAESRRTNVVTVTVTAEPVPVITITTQPTAPAELTEGSITGSLTVEATVTEGATLTYQWYSNTTASNEGGTAIDGATAASFTLPTTLTAGTYYYFCELSAEEATAVRTNAVTVTVNVVALVPVLNSRITWKNGKYALTTDPTDAGLFFKFGSVVGIFTGNGAVLTLPSTATDEFDTGDIAWNPTGVTDWTAIPEYQDTDYPADVDAAYHTVANVKAGKGDPCRLVGLDLNKIKNTAASSLTTADIDNGLWRLPTEKENRLFTGYNLGESTTAHWTTLNDVPGGMFPNVTDGSEATFLPVIGLRGIADGFLSDVGVLGAYWSATHCSIHGGYFLNFDVNSVISSWDISQSNGFPVRCVRQ